MPEFSLYSKQLTTFSRLLPPEGINIYPHIKYIDVNDVSNETRKKVKIEFAHDPTYLVSINFGSFINKGSKVGDRYCVYPRIVKNDDYIGSIQFTEILDNPDGYSKGDFHYNKLIFPKYRFTKYSRYTIGDLIYFMFMANIARNMYVYVPLKNEYDPNSFWMNQVDKQLTPCLSPQYESDSNVTQKYIIPKKVVPGFKKNYLLLEFNGDIYRNMDHRAYLAAAPNRDQQLIDNWLREMQQGVEAIKKLREGLCTL